MILLQLSLTTMDSIRRIGGIGDVYVPTQFREIAAEDASWKLFPHDVLGQFDRIFTHLRRGGVAIVSGDWHQVTGCDGVHRAEKGRVGSCIPRGWAQREKRAGKAKR